jgi:heme-degrading monooxygenase HmoA
MTDSEQDSNSSSESIMADLWHVPDGSQAIFLHGLNELFEQLRDSPGFIEGQILRSANPTKILAYSRFESAAAAQRVRDGPAIAAAVRKLRAIAHQDLSRYTIVESFLPPD